MSGFFEQAKSKVCLSEGTRATMRPLVSTWEQRKWSEYVSISTDMVDPRSGNYDNLPHVGPGNMESFTGRLYDNVNTVKDDALISGKFHFNPGDIIYGKINPQLGKYTYAQFEGLASADAYVLNGKNGLTQEFLFGILQTKAFFDYSVSVSMRSGMPKINRDELNAFEFLAPNESEQRAIGDILLKLDDLITLHQRKCQYRGLYGYLSWEQRKLGEFSKKVTTKNADSGLSETFTNSAEQGVISQLDYFDHDITNDANISGYYVVQPDNFVYNPRISVTAPCGPINRNRLNRAGVMSPLYTVFSVDESVDKIYLEHYFKTSRWHDFMFLEGNSGARSDRFSISNATFFEMPIWCPKILEQRAIAKQLETTDSLITLHQREPPHTMKEGKNANRYQWRIAFLRLLLAMD